MENIYTHCTNCEKLLDKKDIEINKQRELQWFTICTDCVEKYIDRTLDIVSEE